MIVLRLLILALLLGAPAVSRAAPRKPVLHALFVGIDHYRNSDAVRFVDLKGPINDATAVAKVLRDRFALQDPDTTILNGADATRAALLAAIRRTLVDTPVAGDTALFFFAGHGARIYDGSIDETSRYDDTILPYDARDPGGAIADITDDELNAIVTASLAKGVHPVVILDSCHSGTGIRFFAQARAAPDLVRPGLPAMTTPAQRTDAGDGAVLLAAARDTQEALENDRDGVVHGEFSRALVAILRAAPREITYLDVLTQLRVAFASRGLEQEPQGEGPLAGLFLGSGPVGRPPLLATPVDPRQVTLAAGASANVTLGSRYQLFRSAADAAKGTPVLATGGVTRVDGGNATITLDARASLPATLFALETRHDFGNLKLRIALAGGTAEQVAAVRHALAQLDYVELVPGDQATHWLALSPAGMQFQRPDGSSIGPIRPVDDHIDGNLAILMGRIAHYQALLRLTNPAQPISPLRGQIVLATSETGDVTNPVMRDGEAVLAPRQTFRLSLFNSATLPKRVYVLNLDADYCVRLLMPPPGGQDEPLSGLVRTKLLRAGAQPGREMFLAIAADAPITLDALEQPCLSQATLRATPKPFGDPLTQLLSNAASAVRGPTPEVPLDGWSTSIVTLRIEQP